MATAEQIRTETPSITKTMPKPGLGYKIIKRSVDIVASAAALLFLWPLFLVLAFLVKMEDGGPATYVCTRVGKNGKPLHFRKFRSMVLDADNVERYLTPEQLEEYKREFKLDNDPRMTRVGKFIRKTSLDELPQLLAIFKGDMSIVGPRPIVQEELFNYGDRVNELLSVTPGLTGYWQVHGRSNATYESGRRQELELYYVHNCSLWMDLKIIFQTVRVVLLGDGAK